RQIALAAHHYHDTTGTFPTGAHVPVYVGDRPTGGTTLWVELLPYIEQDNLSKQWDRDDNRNNVAGGRNATQARVLKILVCPSDPLPESVVELPANPITPWSVGFYGMTSYGGSVGKRSAPVVDFTRDGIFFVDSCVRSTDVTDGSTNTLLFGERYHR